MRDAALELLPNLGAEEGEGWTRLAQAPAVATTRALWRSLFGARATWADPPSRESSEPRLISDLRADAPVFDWLPRAPGLCPWLSTRQSEAAAARRRLTHAAPDSGVVARVHHKGFAKRFADQEGYTPRALRGLSMELSAEALAPASDPVGCVRRAVESWPAWIGGRFALKPALGSSGRGRVGGALDRFDGDAISGALERLAARGGALLEPWLERSADLSVVFHAPDADERAESPTLLGCLQQVISPSGVYLGHMGEIDARGRVFSGTAHEEAMREAGAALLAAARSEGFHGPCGVDGFVFYGDPTQPGKTREILRPIVEFNARITVGVIVVGLIRRLLGPAKSALGLGPGGRRAFLFALDLPRGWPDWPAMATEIGHGALAFELCESPTAEQRPGLLFSESLSDLAGILSEQTDPRF